MRASTIVMIGFAVVFGLIAAFLAQSWLNSKAEERMRSLEAQNRKQPVVTFNRIGRKIDGIVGLVEKLKQDPKAFPLGPSADQGAE